MSVQRPRILAVVMAGILAGAAGMAADPGATVDRVWPVLPEDDAVTGARTLFEIGYDASILE